MCSQFADSVHKHGCMLVADTVQPRFNPASVDEKRLYILHKLTEMRNLHTADIHRISSCGARSHMDSEGAVSWCGLSPFLASVAASVEQEQMRCCRKRRARWPKCECVSASGCHEHELLVWQVEAVKCSCIRCNSQASAARRGRCHVRCTHGTRAIQAEPLSRPRAVAQEGPTGRIKWDEEIQGLLTDQLMFLSRQGSAPRSVHIQGGGGQKSPLRLKDKSQLNDSGEVQQEMLLCCYAAHASLNMCAFSCLPPCFVVLQFVLLLLPSGGLRSAPSAMHSLLSVACLGQVMLVISIENSKGFETKAWTQDPCQKKPASLEARSPEGRHETQKAFQFVPGLAVCPNAYEEPRHGTVLKDRVFPPSTSQEEVRERPLQGGKTNMWFHAGVQGCWAR